MELLARYFARHQFNVVAPDLPGHGRSDGIPLRSVTAMSEWLMKVFFTVHCDSAIVIGHSMGSLVAMQFACTYPERCTAIVLLGTSVPMPVASILLDAAKDNDPLAFEMANIWSHSRGAALGVNQSPGVWMFGAEARLLNRSKDGVFYADLTVCNEFQFEPAGLGCHVLLILGEEDRMTPPQAGQSLAESFENSQTVILRGCGHSMLSEQPNEVLDALVAFTSNLKN